MIGVISKVSEESYKYLVKPVFFLMNPEVVHNAHVAMGELMGRCWCSKKLLSLLFSFRDSRLEQKIFGIDFDNPIGLSAGFDYDARLTQVLESLGFGFQTVGTVTYRPYEGNKRPMLGRLPKSRSLLVNKGFKSKGCEAIINKLRTKKFPNPLGVSIGATNRTYKNTLEQIEEYIMAFELFERSGIKLAYYEINISCPNLKINPFEKPIAIKKLLDAIDSLRLSKPTFVKMPIDKSEKVFGKMLDEIVKHKVDGVIIGNLTKDRKNPDLVASEVAKWKGKKGNFSGKPTWRRSNKLISYTYKNYRDRFVIIGCGGVFSAEDAYEKIGLGASLVQMITGMIYQGPQVVGQINHGLAWLLKRDGFDNISEAVGWKEK